MEFVSIRSEPAAATVIKQEVPQDDNTTSMDLAQTEPIFSEEDDTFSMEYVDSPTETVIKDELDIYGSNGEKPAQDDVFMEYQKAIKTNVELRKANIELGTYNLKLRNTIEALVENNVELQNSNGSMRETRNELRSTNASLVQINIELQNSTTALQAEKQQLNNQIKDFRLKMLTMDRREVIVQSLIDNNNKLSKANKELQKKLEASEDLLNRNVCSSHFLDDDARCVFYTGLPNKEMFGTILEETLKILPGNPERISSLTPDQRLLIVLMKLKLNYFLEDLANRFHISTTNVSRIIKIWLPSVAQVLGSRIVWLNRDDIKQSLPDCFKCPDFEDAVCIFHCFEMDTQKCKNSAAVPTLSGTNMFTKIKILVGIAPHGAVTFVSEGLAGKVSDDDVAVHSGVLEKLQGKDVVLVDYEYLGHEEFTKRGIRLVIPSLRKQNESRAELIYNSEVTHMLRGHIQRVIGRLRKFKVLSEVLSYYDVTQVGHIVKACAGLVNMRIPVVQ
ncbi:hypothetical protein B566_EDAN006180 [Ephemera danica]|nr:hypothetical protein B566_EDAN006180 [Ephemera danica]